MHAHDELRGEPQGETRKTHRPPDGVAAWASAVGNTAAQSVLRAPMVPRVAASALPGLLSRAPRALQRQADEEEAAEEEPAGGEPHTDVPPAAAAAAEAEELPE